MKKAITSICAVLAAAFSLQAHDGNFPVDSMLNPSMGYLHASASVGFESQYVFRGEKIDNYSIQPQVELMYPIAGFDITAGAWYNAPLYGSKYGDISELDLYADAAYKFDAFTVKAGYIYYWDTSGVPANAYASTMEVYGGVSMDTSSYIGYNINPSVFYFYDWILKQQTVELSFSYEFPVGELLMGWSRLTLPVGIYGGYVSSGNKNKDGQGISYFYYGAQADLAYQLTDYCVISGGVRWSQRNGGQDFDYRDLRQYPIGGAESNIWFGGRISFGF